MFKVRLENMACDKCGKLEGSVLQIIESHGRGLWSQYNEIRIHASCLEKLTNKLIASK